LLKKGRPRIRKSKKDIKFNKIIYKAPGGGQGRQSGALAKILLMKKIFFVLALVVVALGVSACAFKITPAPLSNNFNSENSQTAASASLSETTASATTAAQTPAVKNQNLMPAPDKQLDLLSQYSQALIKTNLGDIKVKFYNADAPLTVNNFLNLAQADFYDGTKFHRVIRDFMIQGGDPNSKDDDWANDGLGGPGYAFQDEINSHKLVLGSLAMANAGANTNGSQFFIVTATSTPWLDGKHTNFGEVIDGLDVVKKIEATPTNANDHPLSDVTITGIELLP